MTILRRRYAMVIIGAILLLSILMSGCNDSKKDDVTPPVDDDDQNEPGTGAPADSWPKFRGDLCNTGYSLSPSPSTSALSWSKALPSAGEFWSSPAAHGGHLYIGNSNGNMYCLNATTGEMVWTFKAGRFAVYSSPVVSDGKVFFGGPDRRVFAVPCEDPNSDGMISEDEVIWKYTVGPSTGGVNDVVCGSPSVKDGQVFLGAIDQYFYCFDAQTGAVVWKTWTPYRGQHAFSSSPAIHDGKVLAATGNQPGQTSSGRLYCFDEDTGAILWEFDIQDISYSSPVIDAQNDLVIVANSGDWPVNNGNLTYKVFCLDLDGYLDGTDEGESDDHLGNSDLVWSQDTGRYVYSSPALHDGRLYFGCINGDLTCLDSATGAKIWVLSTAATTSGNPGGILGSPAIAGGRVFVGTEEGTVLAIPETDPNMDGTLAQDELVWSYQAKGMIVCSPAIANGKVYVGDQQGNMYCFG